MKGSSYLYSQITKVLKMLSLYKQILLAPAQEVLIYHLKLFCGNICNFLLVLLPLGVTAVNFILQTTPEEKKSQGLTSGERAGQIQRLIILSPKASTKPT
jgi:hypothetical protein